MIGKVTKEILYSGGILVPDWQAIKILMSLPDRHDDTIMNAWWPSWKTWGSM